MATTRIIPMHQNKGKSLAQCLIDRTDYSKNPEKTKGGELISCFECDAKTIDSQFLLAKREYKAITGRTQESDVIAYQIRQSFKPGEVTPEQANQIGYQFALRFTKGEHAFMVATHIDKRHVHNHIIWNSTALDCTHKFRNFWGSTQAVRRLSDLLCAEQKLSVIQDAKLNGVAYNTWLGKAAKRSNRAMLRAAIEQTLASAPATLDELLQLLARQGYRVKRGKHISLRPPHAQRYIRLNSLGSGFSQSELLAALTKSKADTSKASAFTYQQTKFNLLVDIQRKMREGKGVGYERWAKVFNLKQMAQTLNYLTENNCEDYADLSRKAAEARVAFNALSERLRITEQRLRELSALRTHLFNYLKTRNTYVAYRKAGYSKTFLAEHESAIILHRAAKKHFDSLGVKKLPTLKETQAEYADLRQKKSALYPQYRLARQDMRSILTAKENVDRLMGYTEKPSKSERSLR